MIYKLNTWYKGQDKHGNSIACLRLDLHTANTDLRNRVHNAICKAMAGPEQEPQEKQGAIGFHVPGAEDQ